MVDFIAIDFETANRRLDSACEMGIAVVEDMKVSKVLSSYIKPQGMDFDPSCVKVHGITPEMVADAPTFAEAWKRIGFLFNPHVPVLAHNARFDMSILKLSAPDVPKNLIYVDSMDIAKTLVEGSRSLAHCTECLGISLDDHHDAGCDAAASAEIALRGMQDLDCVNMWEFLHFAPWVKMHFLRDLEPQKTLRNQKVSHVQRGNDFYHLAERKSCSDIVPTVDCVNSGSPFCGKNIVLTGELSVSRNDAMQMIVNAGGILKSSVSRRTDYLIVGKQDVNIVGIDGMSTKEERAQELNQSGKAQIHVIGEDEFWKMLKNN